MLLYNAGVCGLLRANVDKLDGKNKDLSLASGDTSSPTLLGNTKDRVFCALRTCVRIEVHPHLTILSSLFTRQQVKALSSFRQVPPSRSLPYTMHHAALLPKIVLLVFSSTIYQNHCSPRRFYSVGRRIHLPLF